ncbi:MAG: PorP/SprF family type IX secretion system membrane protein [Paludibacteraceae bacterium]|nr:PorP/SprF family type IX secretion system membrane protein [Paludibacteraceae bacterium]
MVKKYLTLIAVGLFTVSAFAQYRIEFSQYMLNLNTINPAAAGNNDMINVFGTLRSQHSGFDGAPLTYDISADLGFKIGSTKHGAYVGFYDNRVGLFRYQEVSIGYAYRLPLFDGHLSGGLHVDFNTVSYDTERLHEVESDYHSSGDPVIAQTNGNDFHIDLNVGFLYKSPRWWAGVTLRNILTPEYELGTNTFYKKTMNFYTMGGYNFKFANPLYLLKVSAVVNTDFISWSGIANANIEYKERYWGGIGYRIDGAVVFMAGLKVFNGLVIGYSFDLPTSALIKSAGNHEVVLSYSFTFDRANKNKYKSIRFL